jgi:hypothetical protein
MNLEHSHPGELDPKQVARLERNYPHVIQIKLVPYRIRPKSS